MFSAGYFFLNIEGIIPSFRQVKHAPASIRKQIHKNSLSIDGNIRALVLRNNLINNIYKLLLTTKM